MSLNIGPLWQDLKGINLESTNAMQTEPLYYLVNLRNLYPLDQSNLKLEEAQADTQTEGSHTLAFPYLII